MKAKVRMGDMNCHGHVMVTKTMVIIYGLLDYSITIRLLLRLLDYAMTYFFFTNLWAFDRLSGGQEGGLELWVSTFPTRS